MTVFPDVLDIYLPESLDFPDCLTELVSYDTDFDRFEEIRRCEP